jgi:hypothetical protein
MEIPKPDELVQNMNASKKNENILYIEEPKPQKNVEKTIHRYV